MKSKRMKTVAEKIGIKKEGKAIAVHAPDNFSKNIGMPDLKLSARLSGYFDYIHFFASSQAELRKHFLRLKKHLEQTGMLWISWNKKGKGQTDLSLPKIIEIGYDNGLVESKAISIYDTWSAIKFTFPKPGKVYNNSYGKLK